MKIQGKFASFGAINDNGLQITQNTVIKQREHLPLLFNHDTAQIIGKVAEIDTQNLTFTAILNETPEALKVADLSANNNLTGISATYIIHDFDAKADYLELKEIELLEISAVAIPADKTASFTISNSLHSRFILSNELKLKEKLMPTDKTEIAKLAKDTADIADAVTETDVADVTTENIDEAILATDAVIAENERLKAELEALKAEKTADENGSQDDTPQPVMNAVKKAVAVKNASAKILPTPKQTFSMQNAIKNLQQQKFLRIAKNDVGVYNGPGGPAFGWIHNIAQAFNLPNTPLLVEILQTQYVNADSINYNQWDTSRNGVKPPMSPVQEFDTKTNYDVTNVNFSYQMLKIAAWANLSKEAVDSPMLLERGLRQILNLFLAQDFDRIHFADQSTDAGKLTIDNTSPTTPLTDFFDNYYNATALMEASGLKATVGIITPNLFAKLTKARFSAQKETQAFNIEIGRSRSGHRYIDWLDEGVRLYSSNEYAQAVAAPNGADSGLTLIDTNFVYLWMNNKGFETSLDKIVERSENVNMWQMTVEARSAIEYANKMAVAVAIGTGWTVNV
jgi:HK97 family phage prohead protease